MELASLLLSTSGEETLEAIAEESCGHPLFVQELVRYVQAKGRITNVTLDEALLERISETPAALQAILEMVCVAGAPITQETLPPTEVQLGMGTIVSPCPPMSRAETSSTLTPSSAAMKVR